MSFITVATVQEVPVGKSKVVTLKGKKIALFHTADGWYAIEDTCPHRGASLAEGAVHGKEVYCPLHMARFDLTTGQHLSPPARSGVGCFAVQITGDEVQLAVS